MANFEAWKTIDLKTARRVEPYPGTLFTGDSRANLFGVAVLRDGEPVDLTGGSVSGKVARDDGQTVQGITGAFGSANNKAYIVLPQAAYDVPGNITITLRHTAGSTETVLGAWSAYVCRSGTGNELSPGDVVPSLDTFTSSVLSQAASAAETHYVRFDASQALNDTQKGRARANIGAQSSADVTDAINNNAIKYSSSQSLNSTQKTQARENIGAVGYEAQTLTDAQKGRARANIGAATVSVSGTTLVIS